MVQLLLQEGVHTYNNVNTMSLTLSASFVPPRCHSMLASLLWQPLLAPFLHCKEKNGQWETQIVPQHYHVHSRQQPDGNLADAALTMCICACMQQQMHKCWVMHYLMLNVCMCARTNKMYKEFYNTLTAVAVSNLSTAAGWFPLQNSVAPPCA